MLTLSQAEAVLQRVVELGIATPVQIEGAKQEQAKTREPFGAILARLGIVRSSEISKRLAPQLGCLAQAIDPASVSPAVLRRLPLEICRTHRVAAIQEDEPGRLVVATDDPFTAFALEWLGRQCQATLEMVVVGEQELTALLTRLSQPDAPTTVPSPPPRPSQPQPAPPPAPPPPSAPAAPPSPAQKTPVITIPGLTPQAKPASQTSPSVPAPPRPPQSGGQPGGLVVPKFTLPGVPPAASAPKPPVQPERGVGQPPMAAPPTPARPIPPTPPPPRPNAQPAPVRPASPTPAIAPTPSAGAAPGGAEEPIIQLVDSILSEAVRLRASDIHVEPSANSMRVRYRIDGVLHDVNSPPKALQGPITRRLKIMAGLNIAEKRLPQDGRLQLTVADKPLDVRISSLPALHGESIVMRLLTRGQSMPTLNELGFSLEDQQRWTQLIARPYGMILVTGPTGSGKTTTLYATLAVLNRPDRKLITVEDPVEYQLAGVNQVHVKVAVGLTFAAGLRAMLRQAPDVIMVGEIRDQETAQIAIQAALTGHLVFSTLHTNDAPSAVTRLTDMGIAPFLVASTIQGVVAQRLIRQVCASCQARRPATPEEQAFLGEPVLAEVVEGRGCEECRQSGYQGRIGIYELLLLSDAVRQLVVVKSQASALKQRAVQEGMRTLRQDGQLKIRQGLTTVTEVLKATPEGE
ncbi:MAG: hypothetical protein A2105_05590 [Omnitrophica WOR_2 bacterium GWF2_63_9]|nr:MAG: hypothetical protein A2105_05590 [Omnitrophica WOR_2 bacterium GWF2_63_9]